MKSENIMDQPIPNINTPLLKPKNVFKWSLLDKPNPYFEGNLLKPTKYVSKIKRLIKRSKEEVTNLFNKNKKEVINLFDKYRNKVKKGTEKTINWFNYLKNNVLDIFNKFQKKAVMSEPKFKLDKEALNVTKRYTLDLKKAGLALHDPLSLLFKIKSLVIEKFKENPSTKQRLTLECLMKKTNPATGEKTIDKAHFHSYYEEILAGNNFNEIYEKK